MIHYIFWWWQPCIHLSSVKRAPCFRHFAGFPTGRVAHCFLGGAKFDLFGFLLQDLLLGSTRVVFGWNIIFCNKFSSFTSGRINPWDITWTAMNRGLFFRLLLLFLLLEQNHCILYQGPWKHIFHPHGRKNRVFLSQFDITPVLWPISINSMGLSNCFKFLNIPEI